ncbi:hypothetical protein MNBD_GAMMA09-1307 [hydrothermal vent metagenome]|uniref:DUF4442 domain-containing protein n=1 Tax=hydrothermal vent metagenome TaxID=652676 RepID=A0A3B0XIT2_9ZZZZ
MNITNIPFVKTVGIERNNQLLLQLKYHSGVYNHLETIHASAQFALAETASGDLLYPLFPELVGHVIPVVRSSSVKLRKPANSTITAMPVINSAASEIFMKQLSDKGRASIDINVERKNNEGEITCKATFKWFVQLIK